MSPSLISDIDAVENRVLLRGDLHDQFGVGDVAFIKVCVLAHIWVSLQV